ncbi:unnamed protein product [Candidula unifasciata]|uniref:Uncharacterized protein n=1 Tax=Candidula unifasciata TaxID=100452 RepID=A0A8S4A0E7_9EUPU|nr:unnamed protein product [Candidula unifasciata]
MRVAYPVSMLIWLLVISNGHGRPIDENEDEDEECLTHGDKNKFTHFKENMKDLIEQFDDAIAEINKYIEYSFEIIKKTLKDHKDHKENKGRKENRVIESTMSS